MVNIGIHVFYALSIIDRGIEWNNAMDVTHGVMHGIICSISITCIYTPQRK